MGEGGADTAAIEIHHAPLLVAREDDAPAKGIAALGVNQPRAQRQIQQNNRIGVQGYLTDTVPDYLAKRNLGLSAYYGNLC
jgi:hypothetical protein